MKITRRELLLLGTPVLALIAMGFSMRDRRGITITNEPFTLTLRRVRLEPLTPNEVSQGYDTKVAVDLGHRGVAPPWWGKQNGYSGSTSNTAQLGFFTKDGHFKHSPQMNPFRWQPKFEKDTNGYTARYLMSLRHVPPGHEIRLRDRVAVESNTTRKPLCAPVWVNAVARKRGQKTSLPNVSRDSGLKMEGWELDNAPPVETRNQAPRWRLILRTRKVGPNSANDYTSINPEMQDAQKQHVSTFGSSGEYRRHEQMPATSTEENPRVAEFYYDFYFDSSIPPPAGALWLEYKINRGDKWPLTARIPFRDTQGHTLFTPRPAAPFRVMSVKVRPANSTDLTDAGADTLVTIIVQPLGPSSKPMDSWRWEADYSQHVVDARGKRYWEFPFSSGTSTATPSFTKDSANKQIAISYGLNLSRLPQSARPLTFKTTLSANGSRRVPVWVRLGV